jgi:hypothetical protein
MEFSEKDSSPGCLPGNGNAICGTGGLFDRLQGRLQDRSQVVARRHDLLDLHLLLSAPSNTTRLGGFTSFICESLTYAVDLIVVLLPHNVPYGTFSAYRRCLRAEITATPARRISKSPASVSMGGTILPGNANPGRIEFSERTPNNSALGAGIEIMPPVIPAEPAHNGLQPFECVRVAIKGHTAHTAYCAPYFFIQ